MITPSFYVTAIMFGVVAGLVALLALTLRVGAILVDRSRSSE